MGWTSTNVVVIVVGVAVVVFGVLLFRYRVAANRFFLNQQRSTFGDKVGDMMKRRNTPMTAVGIPAIAFVVIGAGAILGGVFGHPH